MNFRKGFISASLAGTVLAFSAPAALAQAQGAYIGGSIGQAQVDGFCDSEPGFAVTSCDDKDTGWKVFLGYRVNRNFAVEGSYMNGGEFGGTVSSIFGTASVKADATAWGIAALGIVPVSEQFELFGKLGFVRGESDADVNIGGTIVTVGDSGTELAYGLGAVYNITRNFGIRAEWENIDDADISLLSIGIQYKFQ
jgi:OOP family OmpA-OmpF porin